MRILDLFCCGGVGAVGYKIAFPEADITGVDIQDMSSCYPFKFCQADALSLDYEFLAGFDFIHASPPCQAYSKITPAKISSRHKKLIHQTMALVKASGLPYVVENVEGSGQDLKPTTRVELGGKRRYFNCSFDTPSKIVMSSSHDAHLFAGRYISKAEIGRAWGIPHEYLTLMRRKNIIQGIPPVMVIELMKYARFCFPTTSAASVGA